MTARALLARLERVRQTGPGRWIARCPAHADTRPSLSVGELPDGRTLLFCFAGCSAEEVVNCVGMTLADLMPPRALGDALPRERRPWPAVDVLALVAAEARLVAVAACNVARGIELSSEDRRRLLLAAERLLDAAELVGGRA
ncbi:MAG: DNA primase [Gammaproteobacteria bacterium]|nr:DNA primase [Gammaproteobacteria bacterium]